MRQVHFLVLAGGIIKMGFFGFNNKKRSSIGGDFDGDGVKNRKDCQPLNWRKQDDDEDEDGKVNWVRNEELPIVNNTEEEIKKALKKERIWRKKHSSYY